MRFPTQKPYRKTLERRYNEEAKSLKNQENYGRKRDEIAPRESRKKKKARMRRKVCSLRALLFRYNWKDRAENKGQGQFMAALPSGVGWLQPRHNIRDGRGNRIMRGPRNKWERAVDPVNLIPPLLPRRPSAFPRQSPFLWHPLSPLSLSHSLSSRFPTFPRHPCSACFAHKIPREKRNDEGSANSTCG